jgi:hypothetical protein
MQLRLFHHYATMFVSLLCHSVCFFIMQLRLFHHYATQFCFFYSLRLFFRVHGAVLCTLRTQISRSMCTFTSYSVRLPFRVYGGGGESDGVDV